MKKLITVINVISGLSILPYPFIIALGTMLFDAPGSENYLPAKIIYLLLTCYPFIVIISIVLSWMCILNNISKKIALGIAFVGLCLLYTSPSPRDGLLSRMPSSA